MKHFSHLNSAAAILEAYRGQQPFHLFLKAFFREHKKYGSSDRKQISQLCYCFFRLGVSGRSLPVKTAIEAALFLCNTAPDAMLAALRPDWNGRVSSPLEEKIIIAGLPELLHQLFPNTDALSKGIDLKKFVASHLQQPYLFLRIRPGKQDKVIKALDNAAIPYTLPVENCLALAQATRAADVLAINKDVVVQDISSQQIGHLLHLIPHNNHPLKIWDCCAASGGKSILATDILQHIQLTVSDIRPSMMPQLKDRFREAGIHAAASLIVDLSAPSASLPRGFDLIIADVPCTGSGTWGRTPERLSFFSSDELRQYSSLQQKIADNVLPSLKPGGYFLYITCSVFAAENEERIREIEKKEGLTLLHQQLLPGYLHRGDTMFAAIFRKEN